MIIFDPLVQLDPNDALRTEKALTDLRVTKKQNVLTPL